MSLTGLVNAQGLQVYSYDWTEHTFQRLRWRYGHERALRIVRDQDDAANADVAAWRALGRRPAV